MEEVSTQTTLTIHQLKTKVLRTNANRTEPLTFEALQTNNFSKLDSRISKQGGTEEDIKARIRTSRSIVPCLKNIWGSEG